MSPLSDEARMLIRMAEQDWEILQVIKDAPRVGIQGVCFHAQQRIEKYLKALLVSQGMTVDRTHNLAALAAKLGDKAGPLPLGLEQLADLNPCAVTLRYDDQIIDLLSREVVLATTSTVRDWARRVLGLQASGQ